MEWGFGLVMAFDDFCTTSTFFHKFDRGDKEVEVEVPFSGVELVKFLDEVRVFESLITDELSDVGPIFVFDVSIVVFVIGSGACKLHGLFSVSEVPEQMPTRQGRAFDRFRNSEPLSQSKPLMGKGRVVSMSWMALRVASCPFPQTALWMVQPVAISTQLIVFT